MNSFLLVCTIAVACLLLANVECYSEPDCSMGCNSQCPDIPECECGTYMDYCKCCNYCVKCPGEECSVVAMEPCADGTTCKAREGATGLEEQNGPGMCT